MILEKIHWKTGASTLEYMALVVFVLGALVVFDKYIIRGFWGQWKKAGDVFGNGKEYDPRVFGAAGEGGGTLECLFVYNYANNPLDSNGIWVERQCFDECMTTPGKNEQTCKHACNEDDIQEVGQYCDY